ncbi:glycosyltransferase [Enterobacter cloacae]|nr:MULTISPECIES: glycosyltransferase [Enterobacter]MBJ6387719.1 glycosyltransferase [Enterobacter cloacae]MBJ6406552.1 glycosyltransferase [Enterobacter cloacae]MBJ6459939.1 glycosyltransferase [Enterobacter cloacae]MBJ6488865.1 glycosyltransferase [Enterobacter cloacae]MBJ6498269.1 glycosyltransferase [Enterobacter cloacae]
MNILVIPSWYPNPKLKTQGLFFRDQALALSKKHNVDVIYCHRGASFYNKEYNDNGLNTHFWGYRLRAGKYIGMLIRVLIFIVMFIKYQKNRQVDVIHCHSVAFNQDGSAGIAGVIIGRLFSKPVIITEHATVFKSKNYGYVEKKIMQWALKNASTLVTVSDGLKENLLEFTNRKDIHTIPNTMDIKLFEKKKGIKQTTSEGEINICSVGYLMQKKGFDRLILAFEKIKGKYDIPFKLKVIGDGPDFTALKEMIETKGLESNIELLGELSKDEIAYHMSQSDVFILLSRVETFGVVVIEALASGLFCIATKSGGPEYIIKNDTLGELLENIDDVDYFSDAIAKILMSRNFRTNENLRKEFVKEHYSYDSFLDSFDNIVLSKYEIHTSN